MNRLLHSGNLRLVIEVMLISMIFGTIMFLNKSVAHAAAELIVIIASWLVFLFSRIESKRMRSKLFFYIGIAYGYSAIYFSFVMLIGGNFVLQGEMASDTFSNRLQLYGRVLENLAVFCALVVYKYFHKISVLIPVLTVLLISGLTLLISSFFSWCSICPLIDSKMSMSITAVLLSLANLFLINRSLLIDNKAAAQLLSIALTVNLLSELLAIASGLKDSAILYGDVLRLISMYLLYKSFETEFAQQNTEIKIENFISVDQEEKKQTGNKGSLEKVENVNSVLTCLFVEHDMSHLIEKIINQMITLLHADGGEIGILDPKRNIIRIVASKNSISQAGVQIPVGVGVIGTTISHRKPVIVESEYFTDSKVTEQSKDCICVPLICDSVLIGAIMATRTDHKEVFTSDDLKALTVFSQSAAIAFCNTQLLEDAQKKAETDSLTGLANHRHFFDLASIEFTRAIRYHHPLTALMFDIDHFKEVNDTFGHSFGDKVLVSIAKLCMQLFRSIDIVGRYGGEEFAVLLPETHLGTATEVAERLRRAVAALVISYENTNISVTISTGIASQRRGCLSVNELVAQADEALYSAKNAGRNKIVVWNEHVHTSFVRRQKRTMLHRQLKTRRRSTKNNHLR